MAEKNILIVSQYVAPVQAVASIRWTKYAKYLTREHGYRVTVLTNKKCFDGSRLTLLPYNYDETLEDDLKWFETRYIPISPSQAVFNVLFNIGFRALNRVRATASIATTGGEEHSARARPLVNRLFSKNIPEKIYEAVERSCGRALASSGDRVCLPWDSYDVVISSYGPLWPHKLAMKIKQQHPQIRWIADFRDAIISSERADTPGNRALTESITGAADAVLGVTSGVRTRLSLAEDSKFFELPNGFDEEDVHLSQEVASDKFRLCYTGTLYSDSDKKSDLVPLLRVISELIDSGEMIPDDVEFSYAGMSSYLFRGMAETYPRVPTVDHGLVSRDAAMELQSSSCALVVACWNTTIMRSGRTAKIYEYMGRGLPIIGLVSGDIPHSGMREFFEECNLGFCYEEADVSTCQGLKDYVLELYRDWKESGGSRRAEELSPEVMRYSYRSLADELDHIIKRLCQ